MEQHLLILSVVPLFALSLLMSRNTNTDSSKKKLQDIIHLLQRQRCSDYRNAWIFLYYKYTEY